MKTNFYTKFKKETPQLAFELEDKLEATLSYDPYEKADLDEDEVFEHRNSISFSIDYLLAAAETAKELNYLIEFLMEYQRFELSGDIEWKIEIDLNKLKYCKTLICYLDEMDEVLALLDYFQDQLVDEQGHDRDRVFFFSENGYCVVRKDILNGKLFVPLSVRNERNVYYGEKHPLQYRWLEDVYEQFQVLHQGEWMDAESIDFEFPYEHLRQEE